uniref:Uncharacterized protein n=1 Tax=Anguilla anguilla TaxID=7936 RepID=A0A0E9UHS7_ANGAN
MWEKHTKLFFNNYSKIRYSKVTVNIANTAMRSLCNFEKHAG